MQVKVAGSQTCSSQSAPVTHCTHSSVARLQRRVGTEHTLLDVHCTHCPLPVSHT
jgi:hypothetical protein